MKTQPVIAFDIHATAPDSVEEFFHRRWGQVHRLQLMQPGLTWNADFFHFGGLTLLSANSNVPFRFETEVPSENIQIVVPHGDCHSMLRAGPTTYNCRAGFGTVIDMRQVKSGMVSAGWDCVQLSLPYETVDQAVARAMGYKLKNRLEFEPVFSLSVPNHKFFADYLDYLFRVTAANADFQASPIAISATVDAIVQYAISFLRHNYSILGEEISSQPVSHLLLRRAIDFIEAHLADPIVVGDIADALDVNVRTLQMAFRAQYDCTPMQFLRRRRLTKVRDELRVIGPRASIRHVAMHWGFVHYYLFRAHYLKEFGEDPTVTANRATRQASED